MSMGPRNVVWGILCILLTPYLMRGTLAKGTLNSFLYNYARKEVKSPQIGKFYDISLRSNYSGIKLSFIQIRTASIWTRGINVRAAHIPPKTRILPFVKRLNIVFQDLGNLSSHYYNVPGHRFVAPVFGLATYNAEEASLSNSTAPPPNISLEGNNTIMLQFPDISVKEKEENATMRCVTFGANGTVQFSNVTVPNRCLIYGKGHFSIVVPKPKHSSRKRLAIGLGVGFGCLILLLIGVLMWRVAKKKKESERLRREAQKSESMMDTAWVGWSKMPQAGWTRTFEVPENDYIP